MDTSATSSVDSHVNTTAAGVPTNKRGIRHAAPGTSRSWLSWIGDKYAEQYVIPAAYAPASLQIAITAFPLGILFGLVLPRTLSFFLGKLGTSASSATTAWYAHPQLSIYLLAWSIFHMLEFTVTASYNPTRLFSDSFLLNNGIHYHIAHIVALIEFVLTAYFYPASKSVSIFTFAGLALIAIGQLLRSMAMIHAHNNFSHIVADKKRTDHELVTTGVYAWTRHPSYVGFFYWAVGTQVMLGNKVGLVGFVVTLWLFFSKRIKGEEKYLVEFFGEKYVEYRKRVGTGLPFI